MKNLLKLLTVILALTLSLGIFAACGHTHDFATLKYDATGHWYECSCGEKTSNDAHKGGTATETAKAVCQVCNQEYGELGAHAHDFSEQVVSELYLKEEAKCESKAIYYFSCACGEKGTKTFEDGEALGHSYTAVVTAPKCEVRGYTTYVCECGNSYVDDYVDAIGHDFVEIVSNGDGTHSKVCANDENHVYTENCTGGIAVCEDQAICEVCESTYGNVPGHDYTRVVTPATCSDKGYTTYICSCGESYVGNYVDATGHVYVPYIEPATCLYDGYVYHICACGESAPTDVIPMLPHEYTDWEDIGYGYAAKYCVNGCNDTIIAKLISEKVLYSAADKSFDLDSLKAGLKEIGVVINSLDDIDSYVINGEEVQELDLDVIINKNGTARGDDDFAEAQTVLFYIDGELYCCLDVYAYTKLIDEASDLDYFRFDYANAGLPHHNGYYLVTKNIDASAYVMKDHVFASGVIYPGSDDKGAGFEGVFDGNGYVISNVTTVRNGIFGWINEGATIKNIAFTNVAIKGSSYPTLFAHGLDSETRNGINKPTTLSNIYVSVDSMASESGVLINNGVSIHGTQYHNIIVEWTNFGDKELGWINTSGGRFGTIVDFTVTGGAYANMFNNVYTITSSPVVAFRSATILTVASNLVTANPDGSYTALDANLQALVNSYNIKLTDKMVAEGIKSYYTEADMIADYKANAASYATFNDCWVVKGGMVYWKEVYYNSFDLKVTKGNDVVEGDIVLSDKDTTLSFDIVDIGGNVIPSTITVNSDAIILAGNTIKLAEKPFKNASYEVTISANIDGVEIVETVTIAVIPKGIDVNSVVNYSAADKTLDFDAINDELGTQFSAEDVVYYTLGNATEEKVGAFELPVLISGIGRTRAIEPQVVRLLIEDEIYVLNNVMAYTQVIDEAEDLKLFTLTGATTDNPYNAVDGYYILANDIDASALVLNDHVFMSGAQYPGNGFSADQGFIGVLDGQGYIIDGLAVKNAGLFGNTNAPIIKNIAFTNATLSGYYPTLFAQTITRSKTPENQFTGHDALLQNIYISIKSATAGGCKRVGVLASQTLAAVVKLQNVVVEYANVSAEIQAQYEAGNDFYMLGTSQNSMAASTTMYENCYAISTAPVLQRKAMPGFAQNQVEYTLTGSKVTAVGAVIDPQVTEVLNRCGKTLAVDHVLVGLKAYADYSAMAAANNDLTSFDSKYWTVSNGVVYWNGTYANQVKAVLRDAEGNKVSNVVLDSADTKLTYGFEDATHTLAGATITAPEGIKVEGNVISLASAPAGKGEYEVSISIVVEGRTLTDTITIAYTNEKVIAGKVLYSAADKALDLTSLNAAGVEIESLADIDGYVVEDEAAEELELEVVVTGEGRKRVVDTAQIVKLSIGDKVYVLSNVYAYTKVIDEAEDLKVFTLTGATTENPYNMVDGYYVLAKNIDASELVLAEHTFISGAVYPGNGYSADNGFEGVLDGQGYTIDGLALKSNGLFGQTQHSVIKNIAFTNVSLSGNYKTVFAHNINRGKLPGNSFSGKDEVLFENVYISVASVATGTARVGILANNNMYTGTTLKNVVVEYLAYEEHVQANIAAGRAFYMLGCPNKDNAATSAVAGTAEYTDVYTISKAPVLAHKLRPGIAINQIECIYTSNKITAVGNITDADTADYVELLNVSVDLNNLMYGVKAYDDYSAMAADTANDYTSFSADYWTISNGVPTWKNL